MDMDEIFMEPLDDYSFGDGLNASRYSDYLSEEKGVSNDCYIQCYSVDGGSDLEGVVSFDIDGPVSRRFSAAFHSERAGEYYATVSVDVFAGEQTDKDTLYQLFSGENRVKLPVTASSFTTIALVTEPVRDPEDPETVDETYSKGIRLSHTMYIGKCDNGVGESRMERIYDLTRALDSYTLSKLTDEAVFGQRR